MSNIYNNTSYVASRVLQRESSNAKQSVKAIFYVMLLVTASTLSSLAQDTWIQKSDFGYNKKNVPQPGRRTAAVSFSINGKGYIGTGSYTDDAGNDYARKDFWEYDSATDTWSQKADFGGTARSEATGFSIGGKGYVGTGSQQGGSFNKDFWEYDQASNKWTQKADFGGLGRWNAVGFSIGSKGYIGTGYTLFNESKDFWEYDPSTNIWTQKADFGGTRRESAVGFSIGSKGYIGTGTEVTELGRSSTKDFWEYNPAANTWTQKADFGGSARTAALGFSISNKGYLGTGSDTSLLKDFWEYNSVNDTWTQKADFGGNNRAGLLGFVISGKGYVGLGSDGNNGYKYDFWEYNPAADAWTQKADFGRYARSRSISMSIGNKGYLGTGTEGDNVKDFWEFDPATNSWSQKATFGGSARQGAVAFSINGKGYIGTGAAANGYTKDFWEYDPVSNTWKQKADFGGVARTDAVGFSIGNKGYIGTGDSSIYSPPMKDFWEYDQANNTWTRKADFDGPERSAATGLSIQNKGYIGTGFNNLLLDLKDFWEYSPASDTWTQKADFGGGIRDYAVGFSINSKGYIGTGGYYETFSPVTYNDFWEYDPDADVWTRKADFGGEARWKAAGFSIGDRGYIGTGINVFSRIGYEKDFWEYAPAGVLALRYTGFTAALQNTNAVLNWQTGGENHVHYFNVQRSFNGNDFTSIARQQATGSVSSGKYVFTDANVTALQHATIFYRLQSVDKDGGSTYSNIAQLSVKNSNNIFLFTQPNPSKGNFTIQIHLPSTAALTSFALYNSFGVRIWQQNAGKLSGSITRDVALESKLPAGVYILVVRQDDMKLIEKVVVVK